MLVTRILGDCPGCRRHMSFGNVNVFGATLVRGCGYCQYSESIHLPAIRKKIVYLDQFFFSSAFRGNDPRFVEAAQRIQIVAGEQLLAAPYSSLHEAETLLWSRREALRDFIKEVSRGAKFAPAYRVEQTQLLRAFQAWLGNQPAPFVLDECDAVHGDLHRWDGYFSIDVGQFPRDPELIRDSKRQSVDGLVALFDNWRTDSTTFEEDADAEYAAAAKGYMDAYAAYVMRIGSGDLGAFMDSPVISRVVEMMMHCVPESCSIEERLRQCRAFFKSEHFRTVPRQKLAALMYSALKGMVKRGAYPKPEKAKEELSGFFYDVEHIATYAPYCDAIIIDQWMAELVAHPRIALEQTFGVKVFSLQDWDQLFDWLSALEASASAEQKAALAAIHPKRL